MKVTKDERDIIKPLFILMGLSKALSLLDLERFQINMVAYKTSLILSINLMKPYFVNRKETHQSMLHKG